MAGYAFELASTVAEAIAALSATGAAPDVVLAALDLPGTTGMEIVGAVRELHPTAQTIVTTSRAAVALAVEAMRHGADDYLVRPFENLGVLVSALERAIERKHRAQRSAYLKERAVQTSRFEELVGSSPGMRHVALLVATVGPTDASVLVLGESGTGKELVVRALLRNSRRRDAPFIAINCGALTESVLESELFGHVKGAFTGAVAYRKGLFEEAAGGTVFLDEVGELTPNVQLRLLRVLQEREVKPLGSNEVRSIDVRVIAATNRDLSADVASGRFRQDLFYRLNVVVIDVPPLRTRLEDVPLLVDHFLRKYAERHGRQVRHIEPSALAILCASDWPGNVRELENTIERVVVLSRGDYILEADLASVVKVTRPVPFVQTQPMLHLPFVAAKQEFVRNYLRQLVLKSNGSLAEAARIAGLDRSNLRRLLRRFRIAVTDARDTPDEK